MKGKQIYRKKIILITLFLILILVFVDYIYRDFESYDDCEKRITVLIINLESTDNHEEVFHYLDDLKEYGVYCNLALRYISSFSDSFSENLKDFISTTECELVMHSFELPTPIDYRRMSRGDIDEEIASSSRFMEENYHYKPRGLIPPKFLIKREGIDFLKEKNLDYVFCYLPSLVAYIPDEEFAVFFPRGYLSMRFITEGDIVKRDYINKIKGKEKGREITFTHLHSMHFDKKKNTKEFINRDQLKEYIVYLKTMNYEFVSLTRLWEMVKDKKDLSKTYRNLNKALSFGSRGLDKIYMKLFSKDLYYNRVN